MAVLPENHDQHVAGGSTRLASGLHTFSPSPPTSRSSGDAKGSKLRAYKPCSRAGFAQTAGSLLHHAREATVNLCSDLGQVAGLIPTGREGESTSQGYFILRYFQLK